MIFLNGNSLGERQKDLNEKVNKAVVDNTFDKCKTEFGNNDIDKIFLIDLAAKHKNFDFLLEILKSGDIVHITRALNKCTWLSDSEFANIINVDHLHLHIFPMMSIKMKKKLLCTISINIKTASRATAFHEYCMKERLFKIAMKFLFNTSESFKNDVILQNSEAFNMVLSNKEEALANFIGNSFSLVQTFLNNLKAGQNRNDILDLLRYMCSISDEQYLGLLEKYIIIDYYHYEPTRLGSRLSKKILTKHKDRISKNPLLYVNLLKKDKIAKNSTLSDVKVYAVSLLPDKASIFWNINFYEKYKFILDIIPADERFCFIRKIFTEKYPDEEFEMSKQFYFLNYYNTMTKEEKENWALRHITAGTGEVIFGNGNDYKWYKFVCFDKAFEEIKKYIFITTDNEKRMEMINVLTDSAKTQNEVETLLNYFYNRHVNELIHLKHQFLDNIIAKHNVFNFDEKCWIATEKIFYSLDVYTSKFIRSNYREIALIYYIINKKTVPKPLLELIESNITVYEIKSMSNQLAPEKEDMVFQYIHNFYLKAVESLACKDDVNITRYISGYLELLHIYSKTKNDIAESINKLIKANWNEFKHHSLFYESVNVEFSQRNIMRYMKKDATLVIDEFPLIKQYIEERFGRTNWLFQKLKIYFEHDIAKRYLQLLNDCLSADDVHYHDKIVQVAVYGIFKLADEPFKLAFMQKHVPVNPKIDHVNISRNLLNIQQAICSYACVSRPPLPIDCVIQYLKEDYVRNCLPMFNYYLMNLPIPACVTFVKSVIDKPVSIQKHGLRLAFQCFNAENLKTLINGIWKRTKNISIRKIIYNSLLDKVLKEREQTQLDLFKILNTLTLNLHEDDDNELFLLLTHNKMPNHLMGQHLVCGWKAVKKLPEKSVNFQRMTRVIQSIETNFTLVPEDEIITITDDHVSKMLDEKEILIENIKDNLDELLSAKWELTLRYLTNVYSEQQLKKNLEIVRHIIKRCLEMRNEVRKEKLVVREFLWSFIKDLDSKSFNCHKIESYSNMKIICDAILKYLQEALPEYEIFALTLELRLNDISRNIIISYSQKYCKGLKIDESIILFKFAEMFVMLLNEYLDNGKHFATFNNQIVDSIIKQLAIIHRKLDIHFTLDLNRDDLIVLMCVGLLKFEITEVYLLIVILLPLDYYGIFVLDYETTISTVKAFKNNEVQCIMFEKFVNCDFILRKQLLTQME